ncbi:MAG: hypothetical protein Q7T53_13440 [Deltaproteobacteria bacterium]|nr:hypothetical protein [Deltaproteobacteria bacterium]
MSNNTHESHENTKVIFFIDKEKCESPKADLSVRTLLQDFAKEDPTQTTLVISKGNDLTKLTNLDQIIHLENGMKFVVYHNTPTVVSFNGYGPERLISELDVLGYNAEIKKGNDDNAYAIIKNFEVSLGRFAGRIIDLGILATADFPRTVGSSIHVLASPQLLDLGSVPNVRNIIESKLGPEWRYWSHNFNWTSDRSARRLLSQINGVFEHA